MEETINAYKVLVRKYEGKRPFGRSRRRWGNDIRKDLRKTEWTQDRDQWWALTNRVITFGFHTNQGIA
jgi:hypothetical protein